MASGSGKQIRGITKAQEINPEDVNVPVRTFSQRIGDWLKSPSHVVVALLMMASSAWYYAAFAAWFVAAGLLLVLWGLRQKETAPVKIPIQAKMLDPNQPHPKDRSPTPGQGIFFLGNDLTSGKEVWLTNSDCRQHFLVLGTTGAGKSTPDSAPVHTPLGWREMGSIKVGDRVSTPDGRSAPVSGVFPQGDLPVCRVWFEDGRSAEVSPDHLWRLGGKDGGRKLLSTADIAARVAAGSPVSVPLPEPVEKPVADLPVEPYVLGSALARACLLVGVNADVTDAPYPACQFRGTGLEEVAPEGLRVPLAYREGSVAQRWALLQGMMDVSGTVSMRDGSVLFSAAGRSLALDVQEVVWSLGGIAAPSGHDGRELRIRHPLPTQMFSDPHKSAQAALVADGDAVDSLAVASIEMGVRRERSTCILVDHPDHLFITKDYVVTHNTESLLGFAANALSWGSGFLFCDGKGDVALFAKVYAMARRFGREDDLLVLNFMTGNTDLGSSGGEILSNTLNPFSTGSSDGLTQMVVSLMDDVGGDGAMWKGRATAMLTGIMRALCWLRDQGYLELNVGEIRDHMNLKRIIELADENKHPDLPPQIRKSIKSYLSSLPGFQEEKKEKQAQTTLDQHGYLEMQFTKILGSLADVYGHIFATPYGEVDMYDVVLGRRILVIMLPALEKSGDEIANLGKIVVATLKGMMGATLGSRLEGSWEEVVENRPTNSPSPFICILDEVGYYTVEGMALMAAQARSLGFSMVYASQDIGAMKRLNEKEAASIVGNTNTKIFMRIEDPNETTKLAVDRGDKALRVRVDGFERRVGEIMGSRHAVEGERGSFEETSRINATDLAAQGEGEMHILHQDIIVRARGFYANPEGALEKKKLRIRSNHFVKVPRPTLESIEVGLRGPDIIERLADPNTPVELAKDVEAALAGVQAAAEANDEIAMAARAFDRVLGAKRKPIEAACAAVAEVMQVLRGATGAFVEDVKGAYAAVPAAPGSFSLDDFETDIGGGFVGAGDPRGGFADAGARGGFAQEFEAADFDDGGYAESARGGKQGRRERFADPFGPPPGVTVPADAGRPPRRPPAPRKPHRVDPAVRHGATVDDGAIIDMADKIASNDAIMRSLAALEFDGDQVTSQQVEARIEEAIGSARKAAPEAMPERVDSFDRAAGAVRQSPAAGPAHKENTEGGDADGDGEGEFVASFLEGLLSDEE